MSNVNHAAAARQMVIDFHIAIEKWFKGENEVTLDYLLHFFSKDFRMTGAVGKAMDLEQLAAWLPSAKGMIPSMVITVDKIVGNDTFCHALVAYEEKQQMGEVTTLRRSSAVFRLEEGALKWWWLTEEWI